jgi:hypothetical protein
VKKIKELEHQLEDLNKSNVETGNRRKRAFYTFTFADSIACRLTFWLMSQVYCQPDAMI